MRRKARGTLQIQQDVKRLFMLAKPLNMTSSEFLKGLLLLHAREVRQAQQQTQDSAGAAPKASPDTHEDKQVTARLTCLGRPPGAKDLQPRRRRTKVEIAKSVVNES